MPDAPMFEAIAEEIVAIVTARSGAAASSKAATRDAVARHLRHMWNARGASDIARLEVEIPKVWATAEPAGALTRALRALDC
jgi:hypothetical protein